MPDNSRFDKFWPRPGTRWDYDFLRRKYAPRQIPLPAPDVGILDEPKLCVQINEEWFSHILGAWSVLEQQDAWTGDEQAVYNAIQQIELLISSVRPCPPTPSGDCGNVYTPDIGWLTWAPIDPFAQPGFAPNPYNLPPWRIATGPTALIPGLQQGDVYTDYFAFASTLGANIFEILNNLNVGFPRFSFTVEGEGEVEFTFVGFPQGGYAYVVVDRDFLSALFVELVTETVQSFDSTQEALGNLFGLIYRGGLFREKKAEVTITGEGQHLVEVFMLPKINIPEDIFDVVNILGFGGGIREINLCGFASEGLNVPQPEFRVVNCELQTRPNPEAEWSTVPGGEDICGDEGAPGAPGAAAPVPDVQITEILGGTSVDFDMDGDGLFEDGFTVLDGIDGTSPTISTVPINGGNVVNIDNDGDGNIDETFTVFDGTDGVDGADGECPDCPPAELPPVEPPGGFTDTDYCAAAFYVSERYKTVFDSAIASLIATGTYTNWYEEFSAALTAGIYQVFLVEFSFIEFYDRLRQFSQEEVDIINAESPFLRDALRDEIYCNQNFTLTALDNAVANTPALTQPTADTATALRAVISESTLNAWIKTGLIDNRDADCSGIICPETPVVAYDFTVDEQGFASAISDTFYAPGEGWKVTNTIPGSTDTRIRITRSLPSSLTLGRFVFYYTAAGSDTIFASVSTATGGGLKNAFGPSPATASPDGVATYENLRVEVFVDDASKPLTLIRMEAFA